MELEPGDGTEDDFDQTHRHPYEGEDRAAGVNVTPEGSGGTTRLAERHPGLIRPAQARSASLR